MVRTERLLALLDILRRRRRPTSGATLAAELGVSLRTLYRDIATLQAGGAPIDGEAGMGYQLRPGYFLPPLMFTEEQIEAIVLGLAYAAREGDPDLVRAASLARARIAAVLPESVRERFHDSGLLVGGEERQPSLVLDLAWVRQAIREERKVLLRYADADGVSSNRTIWPFALGYFRDTRLIAAWCELRQAIRHFRADRVHAFDLMTASYPRRRAALLAEWRAQEGVPRAQFEDC